LLANEDNKFVIGRQGDTLSLLFPADNLAPPAEGMQRSYYFFVACWFKVQYANYGFGSGNDGFTVTPLPFHNMSGFPYPLQTESYPNDTDHNNYLREYNNRTIELPPSPSATAIPQGTVNESFMSTILLVIVIASTAVAAATIFKIRTMVAKGKTR
jgi:hypothetical protein